jgi:hypothetical protein
MTRTMTLCVAAALAAMLAGGQAAADTPALKRPPALQAVVDCGKIADDGERLKCFDAAVAKMTEAEKSGDLVAIDREQRRAVTRQAFGFALPSLTMFDRGDKSDEADRLTETLAASWQTSDGKWVFRLQNGAVWRQIDDNYLSRDPHPGSAIVIRRAMLGSYILNVDGQPALKVHRDS